ncbi:hypothetical protein OROMI_033278 [Orobanche minor]
MLTHYVDSRDRNRVVACSATAALNRGAGEELPTETVDLPGYYPIPTNDQVKDCVREARNAQKLWAKCSIRTRRQFLEILLKYIVKEQYLICKSSINLLTERVSSHDSAKTMLDASLREIVPTCEKISLLLSEGEKWLEPVYRSPGRLLLRKNTKVEFHPLGVIGVVVSWDYSFRNILNPILAAVFAGNGVVIKVMKRAVESLTPITVEFVRKYALVVCCSNCREGCSTISSPAAERFYVHSYIFTSFSTEVVKLVRASPNYAVEAIGMRKLRKLVEDALQNGAKQLCGVNLDCTDEGAASFPITVIEKVNHGMAFIGSEAFGLIIAIMEFGSDEEAVELANHVGFGFSYAIFSGS